MKNKTIDAIGTTTILAIIFFLSPYAFSTSYSKYVNEALLPSIVYADTTAYSAKDSCHYKGCPTASGVKPYEGSVACPREIPLKTKVKIEDKIYTCEDRTAKWVEEKFGGTYDIFIGYSNEDYKLALKYGRQNKKVEILK